MRSMQIYTEKYNKGKEAVVIRPGYFDRRFYFVGRKYICFTERAQPLSGGPGKYLARQKEAVFV